MNITNNFPPALDKADVLSKTFDSIKVNLIEKYKHEVSEFGVYRFSHLDNEITFTPGDCHFYNIVTRNWVAVNRSNMLLVMNAALNIKPRVDGKYDYRETSGNVVKKQSELLRKEASELDSDLAYMGKMKQSFRAEKVEYFEEVVLPKLKESYVVEIFAPNSYRIRKQEGSGTVDFYPPKGRLFVHKTKKWYNVSKDQVLKQISNYL